MELNLEDLLEDCAEFITGFIEVELKTAGYSIMSIGLETVSEVDSDNINLPVYGFVFDVEVESPEVDVDSMEVVGNEVNSFVIPAYIINLQRLMIDYPDEVDFPDNELGKITEKEIGESIEHTEGNKTDVKIIEIAMIFYELKNNMKSDLDLNYLENAINTNLYNFIIDFKY